MPLRSRTENQYRLVVDDQYIPITNLRLSGEVVPVTQAYYDEQMEKVKKALGEATIETYGTVPLSLHRILKWNLIEKILNHLEQRGVTPEYELTYNSGSIALVFDRIHSKYVLNCFDLYGLQPTCVTYEDMNSFTVVFDDIYDLFDEDYEEPEEYEPSYTMPVAERWEIDG